ncbi:MAG: DegT/DnrJ/EryC1/StrS family aminotransferase [Chloroflexia bacterium]
MKVHLDDLAAFGGAPTFPEKIHVGRPNIGDRDRFLARVNDMLDRKWLSNNGPYVQEFERKLAEMIGVKHCIAICNATIALEIAIRAVGLKGEVIVPSFTFVATAHALQWQEITPVFCDMDRATHNLDPRRIEELITPRTTGIIGVHLWGRACDVDALTGIAREHNLKLLFDAAHAFACSYRGRMIGNFGDAEVFSFHATKFFNTFEGGAITTNNDELAAKIRLMKNFGFAGYDRVVYVGTNGKMSEVSAAMGLTGLESLDELVAINHRNYNQYLKELQGLPGIRMIAFDDDEKHNYQYIVVEVDEGQTHISRDDIVHALHKENVLARRYFYPGVHKMEPYNSYFPQAGLMLPVTEEFVHRVMVLPTGTAVSSEEIASVCQLVRFLVENGSAVSERLSRNCKLTASPS